MKRFWNFAQILILILFSAPQLQAQSFDAKTKTIDHLKRLQKEQVHTIEIVDKIIREKLIETQSIRLKETAPSERSMEHLNLTLKGLQAKREEYTARRAFIDQLIFRIDTKWTGTQPLRSFLEHQLLEMSLGELSGNAEGGKSWRFLNYLSIAVRELPEPREDILAFIEGYMNFSTIQNPKPPTEFAAKRNYTNGAESMTANPVKRENLGEYVENKLGR